MTDHSTLVRARGRDLPVLALVAGAAMATRPFGRWLRWPLAAISWPCWLIVLWLSTPHVWRIRHRAVVSIYPPGMHRRPGWRRIAAFLAAVPPLGVILGALLPVERVLLGLGVVVFGFLLVYVGLYPGRLTAGPKAAHVSPPVVIDMAASVRDGSGVLTATERFVDGAWPGAELEVVARDATLATLYAERWALTQVTKGHGRMVGRAGDLQAGSPAPPRATSTDDCPCVRSANGAPPPMA